MVSVDKLNCRCFFQGSCKIDFLFLSPVMRPHTESAGTQGNHDIAHPPAQTEARRSSEMQVSVSVWNLGRVGLLQPPVAPLICTRGFPCYLLRLTDEVNRNCMYMILGPGFVSLWSLRRLDEKHEKHVRGCNL